MLGRGSPPPVLLSGKSDQLAGIDQWENKALDARPSAVEGGRGSNKTPKARQVEVMVQDWEDRTLSGRKNSKPISAEPRELARAPQAPLPQHLQVAAPAAAPAAVVYRGSAAPRANAREQHQQQARAVTLAKAALRVGKAKGDSAPASSSVGGNSKAHVRREAALASMPKAHALQAAAAATSLSPKDRLAAPGKGGASRHGEAGGSNDARKLNAKAEEEESKASQLVGYADKVAQRIIKDKALDAMKRWLGEQRRRVAEQRKTATTTARTVSSSLGMHSNHRGVKDVDRGGDVKGIRPVVQGGEAERLKGVLDRVEDDTRRLGRGDTRDKRIVLELTRDVIEAKRVGEMVERERDAAPVVALKKAAKPAAPPAKPNPPATLEETIRTKYDAWRKNRVDDYAKDHNLFSANEFCNSRQNADHPTVGELVKLFGDQWRTMAVTNPEVATLAAVSPCLAALGVETPGVASKSVYAQAWSKGPLAGREGDVKRCAGGDRAACVAIAKDPAALRELKALIPEKLRGGKR